MVAREWKCTIQKEELDRFLQYLKKAEVKDCQGKEGCKGYQVLKRVLGERIEVTLITYWVELESIAAFEGNNITDARLFPDGAEYGLESDPTVIIYDVVELKAVMHS